MKTKSLFITLCALLVASCAGTAKDANVDAILAQEMYMEHERMDLSTFNTALGIAFVGNYNTFAEMKNSPFYPLICQIHPEIKQIDRFEVDMGRGGVYLVIPKGNMTLSLNEYTLAMFMQEQNEDEGRILYRNENPRPFLIRCSTDMPGSVRFVAAPDNGGEALNWVAAADRYNQLPVETVSFSSDIIPINMSYHNHFGIDPEDEWVSTESEDNSIRIFHNGLCFLRSHGEKPLMYDYFAIKKPSASEPERYLYLHDNEGHRGIVQCRMEWKESGNQLQKLTTLTPVAGHNFGLEEATTFIFRISKEDYTEDDTMSQDEMPTERADSQEVGLFGIPDFQIQLTNDFKFIIHAGGNYGETEYVRKGIYRANPDKCADGPNMASRVLEGNADGKDFTISFDYKKDDNGTETYFFTFETNDTTFPLQQGNPIKMKKNLRLT